MSGSVQNPFLAGMAMINLAGTMQQAVGIFDQDRPVENPAPGEYRLFLTQPEMINNCLFPASPFRNTCFAWGSDPADAAMTFAVQSLDAAFSGPSDTLVAMRLSAGVPENGAFILYVMRLPTID